MICSLFFHFTPNHNQHQVASLLITSYRVTSGLIDASLAQSSSITPCPLVQTGKGVNLDGIGSLCILPSDNSRLGRCHICQTKRPSKRKFFISHWEIEFGIGRVGLQYHGNWKSILKKQNKKDASLVAAKLAKQQSSVELQDSKEKARKADKECVLG